VERIPADPQLFAAWLNEADAHLETAVRILVFDLAAHTPWQLRP